MGGLSGADLLPAEQPGEGGGESRTGDRAAQTELAAAYALEEAQFSGPAMLVRGLGYTSLAGTADGYSVPFTDVAVNRGFITAAYALEEAQFSGPGHVRSGPVVFGDIGVAPGATPLPPGNRPLPCWCGSTTSFPLPPPSSPPPETTG